MHSSSIQVTLHGVFRKNNTKKHIENTLNHENTGSNLKNNNDYESSVGRDDSAPLHYGKIVVKYFLSVLISFKRHPF